MANTDYTSGDSDERARKLNERLRQIDAIMVCANAVISSPESSLFKDQVSVLFELSRELIEECSQLNEVR